MSRRRRQLALRSVLPLLAVAVAALLAVALKPERTAATGDPMQGAASRLVASIGKLPQDGITLGDLGAPATLTLYTPVDAFLPAFYGVELPELIDRLIEPGRMKLQIRTLPSPGASRPRELARTAQAIGLRDRLWEFLAQLGVRHAGGSGDELVEEALAAISGVRPGWVARKARSRRVRDAVARAARFARQGGVRMPPAFVVSVEGGGSRELPWPCTGCLTEDVREAVEALGAQVQ